MSDVLEFHISDVLTVTTGNLLSQSGVDGIYEILNHLSGDSVFTHQIPRALEVYGPYLKGLFPELDSPELQLEIGRLSLMLETAAGKENPRTLIDGWLLGLSHVGQSYDLAPAPELWRVANPVHELADMLGADRVIIAEVQS